MRYLLALVVVVGTLAALIWTGIDIRPTVKPEVSPDTKSPVTTQTATSIPTRVQGAIATMDAPTDPVTPPTSLPSPNAGISSPRLLIPVQDIPAAALVDTFTDARSQGRSHDAIDIMAPAGTPVVAVADGHIEKLFTSERGGLTIYQFEPDGRLAYYYAHLQRYAPGLAEKQTVTRGQLIGYVGSTGNASPDAPHLHFAVFELGPEKRWWEGTAINPYPLLTAP